MTTTSDKVIAYLALISGLAISAVAIWYSVAGLVSIFAAAAIPIMIMGVSLEVGKLAATVWVKQNWDRAPFLIKTYLITAIVVLMFITSMGIFGYLSKAHLDQAVPTGDVADKVELIDDKIKTERDNITASKSALTQMDAQVNERLTRSTDDRGAERAVQIRRQQLKERAALQNDIAKAQAKIAVLNEERSPIAKELRKVEAEVGPIKYIAALIYGDNPDQNLLESAVRWVIIIIVMVFDPLAVILLLASQYSFQWFRRDKDNQPADAPVDIIETDDQLKDITAETIELPQATEVLIEDQESPIDIPQIEAGEFYNNLEDNTRTEVGGLEGWNTMIAEAEKAVEAEKIVEAEKAVEVVEEVGLDDDAILESASVDEKTAMAKWKQAHPDNSLKIQRKLLDRGLISRLPWEDSLKAEPDFSENTDAEEAAKWALEQVEEAKKKVSNLDGTSRGATASSLEGRIEGYVQNAEQNPDTIWQKVQDTKKGNE